MTTAKERQEAAVQTQLLTNYRERLRKLHECWSAHEGQRKILRAIYNDGYRRVFVQAGRKFGKTELCMYAAWRTAVLNDNAHVYIIGPSRKQQDEILWHTNRLQNFGPDFGQEVNKTESRIVFPWGSFIKVDGSEQHQAYRGTQYDLMILDEYKDCNPLFYKDSAFANLLTKNGTLIVIGTPPDKEDHYIALRNEAREDEDWMFHYATSWENDKLEHGKEWLTKEKAKYYKRGDGRIWEREYEARFVPGGANAIFPQFQKRKHTRDYSVLEAQCERDRRKLQWYTISDPGTSSCFCVLFICYNPYTSQVFILDEIYETDRTKTSTTAIWDRVLEKKHSLCPEIEPTEWLDIYDEAAAWFAAEVANHYNHGLVPTHKKAAKKEAQISLIKDVMLREGAFYVAGRCVKTIWEIQNYVTDDKGDYPKVDDHAVDCLRYFFSAAGYNFDMSPVEVEEKRERYTPDQEFEELEAIQNPFNIYPDDEPNLYDLELDDDWLM